MAVHTEKPRPLISESEIGETEDLMCMFSPQFCVSPSSFLSLSCYQPWTLKIFPWRSRVNFPSLFLKLHLSLHPTFSNQENSKNNKLIYSYVTLKQSLKIYSTVKPLLSTWSLPT